ncbi:RICIN domain-containing protein [Hymenobacter weizhouensis]|uniref:RICIN domain-containing protein n=1 Tax=Hymenobacter sp. YIM 151500-1 TaxID=2987689 RepID=UPI0022269883|nr:RICIN domain-containing protein [Hymenobacter sp. YIM 151500-1]UYZ64951.1 RICIN domain-containing protein [Hymenobacter sp. YIM 151500-1]
MKKPLLALAGCLAMFSAQAQRDPLKWPYARTSVWNMPLHTSAQYTPAGIKAATDWGFGDDDIHIIARPTAPRRNVYKLVRDNDRYWTNRCERAAGNPVAFSAPIPADYTYTHPTHNNIFAVFTDNTHVVEALPMQYCTDIGQWTAMWPSNVEDVTGDGLFSGGHGASHLSALGGTIRVGELRPGSEIRHALKILVDCGQYAYYRASEPDGKPGYRWPAHAADAYAASGYGGTNPEMQMGALLALKPDFNIGSLKTEPARIIARALQNYGAYLVDDSAWDNYILETEDGPDGNVRAQVWNQWNVKWNEQSTVSGGRRADCNQASWDWVNDMAAVMTNLHVVKNNAPTTMGGGPTTDETNRRAAMACDFGPAGSGGTCPSSPPPTTGFAGTYTLTARHSGKRLDVDGNSNADKARVWQYTANTSSAQRWVIASTGDGYYTLTHEGTTKRLDVDGGKLDNGVTVWQYEANGLDPQKWKIEPTSDGYYKLTSKASGKCLDVNGGSSATADKVLVHQWDYWGGTNQQWKLEKVSSARPALSAGASTVLSPELAVYPNPARAQLTVRYRAAQAGAAELTLTDGLGRVVRHQRHHAAAAGSQQATLDVRTLPAGTYLLDVRSADAQGGPSGRPQRVLVQH